MKKLFVGLLASIIFLYLTFKGVEFEYVLRGLKDVRIGYLIPAAILFLTLSGLRSLRWGIILEPLEKISQKKLFPINCIGYMAIILIPMRIGELIRPYLVSRESQIMMSSALATVFIERIMDIFTILGLLFVIFFISDPPGWLIKSGYSVLPILFLLVLFICLLYFRKEQTLKFINKLLIRLPAKLHDNIEGLIRNFTDGLGIISSPKRLLFSLLLTVLIWIFSTLAIYSLYLFQNFQLSLASAFILLVVTMIGISLPTAPGMVGNFQYGSIVALSFFNVPKSDAFLFAMTHYVLGVGIILLLGLIFLPFVNISIREIGKIIQNKAKV